MQSNKGSALLVAIFCSIMASGYVYYYLSEATLNQKKNFSKRLSTYAILQARSIARSAIQHYASFINTVNHVDNNPEAAAPNDFSLKKCLNDPNYVCNTTEHVLILYGPGDPATAGPLINNNPTSGFKLNGQPCNTFVQSPPNGLGNIECPIHVRTTWKADCGGPATCSQPKIKAYVYLEAGFPEGVVLPIKASAYNVAIELN